MGIDDDDETKTCMVAAIMEALSSSKMISTGMCTRSISMKPSILVSLIIAISLSFSALPNKPAANYQTIDKQCAVNHVQTNKAKLYNSNDHTNQRISAPIL